MNINKIILYLVCYAFIQCIFAENPEYISHIVDTQKSKLLIYGKPLHTISRLQKEMNNKNKRLLFAMNGGMFSKLLKPEGLHIQEGQILSDLNNKAGNGNFYLKPGGIFSIKKDKTISIDNLDDFKITNDIKFATQSGPLLVENYKINPIFNPKSSSKYTRNGVGILNKNKAVFIISTNEISLYEFAKFFKDLNCSSALYLDGYVSGIYLPDIEINSNFGLWSILIAETKDQK